jgi:hypothetical protein
MAIPKVPSFPFEIHICPECDDGIVVLTRNSARCMTAVVLSPQAELYSRSTKSVGWRNGQRPRAALAGSFASFKWPLTRFP